MHRASAMDSGKQNVSFCMKGSQMKNQPVSPIAVLVLVFIYYFLKFALETAVGGASMAVVEGVSSGVSGWNPARKAMLISPVFAYLAFAVLHIASKLLRWSKYRIAKAVEQTFQFHIAFFVVSVAAFFLSGPQTIYMFEETAFGGFTMAVGKLLPLLLVGFFMWRYVTTPEQPEAKNSMVKAFGNT